MIEYIDVIDIANCLALSKVINDKVCKALQRSIAIVLKKVMREGKQGHRKYFKLLSKRLKVEDMQLSAYVDSLYRRTKNLIKKVNYEVGEHGWQKKYNATGTCFWETALLPSNKRALKLGKYNTSQLYIDTNLDEEISEFIQEQPYMFDVGAYVTKQGVCPCNPKIIVELLCLDEVHGTYISKSEIKSKNLKKFVLARVIADADNDVDCVRLRLAYDEKCADHKPAYFTAMYVRTVPKSMFGLTQAGIKKCVNEWCNSIDYYDVKDEVNYDDEDYDDSIEDDDEDDDDEDEDDDSGSLSENKSITSSDSCSNSVTESDNEDWEDIEEEAKVQNMMSKIKNKISTIKKSKLTKYADYSESLSCESDYITEEEEDLIEEHKNPAPQTKKSKKEKKMKIVKYIAPSKKKLCDLSDESLEDY